MTLSIRNSEAEALAKRLAELTETTIADAVLAALRDAVAARTPKETAREAARRIRAEHGLGVVSPGRKVPESAYREFDHDVTGRR